MPVQFGGETFSGQVSAIYHFSLPFDAQRTPRVPRTSPRATFQARKGASLSRRMDLAPGKQDINWARFKQRPLAACVAHVIENALKKLLGQGSSSCPASPMRCSQLHQIRARLLKPNLQLNSCSSFGTLFGVYWGKGLALVSVLPDEVCPVRASKPQSYRVSYTP